METCYNTNVKPCVKCGAKERYARSGRCVPCKVTGGRRRYQENPQKHHALTRKWAEQNPERRREINRTWKAANPDKIRAYTRKQNRLDGEWAPGEHERAEALLPLVSKCDCCGSTSPRHKSGWRADHNHQTGIFRGFLCHACNVVIGFVEKYGLTRSVDIDTYLRSR